MSAVIMLQKSGLAIRFLPKVSTNPSRCWRRQISTNARDTRHASTLQGVSSSGISPRQIRHMEAYVSLLMEQNKVMNLTAIKSSEEAWERHVQDSVSLLPAIETCLHGNAKPARLVDVGSGAGLPGIVLGIARPGWQILLLDSIQKRCKFVEDVIRHLDLPNVDVLWSRAEHAGRQKHLREIMRFEQPWTMTYEDEATLQAFDVAIARAVAEMRTLTELSLPLIRIGGHLVAAKGPDPQEEIRAAQNAIMTLGGSLQEIAPVASFSPQGQRTVVIVKKRRQTPKGYPRENNLPKKKPL